MQKFILIISLSFMIAFSSANAFETNATYAILMDYDTKTVLFEKEAHTKMAPSSMSKMMTAYIAFESLRSGQVKLTDEFYISEKAWKAEGTRMFIPLNTKVSFEDLLRGLIIDSGNDAAIAIAEALMGSEDEFASLMNDTAKKLGMNESNFLNATGLPLENNYSTCYDLALLSYHTIKDFPEYYPYYAEKEFTYNGIKQGNRNGLLYKDMGADGLKTGHAADAGYGLAASAKRDGRRVIGVVNGLKSNKERTIAMEQLVTFGFMNFKKVIVAEEGQIIEKIPVVNGNKRELELVAKSEISIIVPKMQSKNIKTTISYNSPVNAPILVGDKLGVLEVENLTTQQSLVFDLVAKESIEKADFFGRIKNKLSEFF